MFKEMQEAIEHAKQSLNRAIVYLDPEIMQYFVCSYESYMLGKTPGSILCGCALTIKMKACKRDMWSGHLYWSFNAHHP